MDRRLIVMARNQVPLWGYLRQQFSGDSDVEVILDRRRWQRRRQIRAHDQERRRADRRRKPVREEDLHTHGLAVIRRQPRVVDFREIEKLIGELQNQIGVNPPGDPTTGIRGEPSMQTRSTEGTRTVERRAPSNGISATSLPQYQLLGQEGEKWQELLRKVGIEGLRFPENGALCAPWQKFLNDLNDGT